jgi:anti-sigma B factor antagonist
VSVDFHGDPAYREEIFRRYLRRALAEPLAGELESHYLVCEECFEEITATRLLLEALDLPPLATSHVGGVTVLRFSRPTELLSTSLELQALQDAVRIQNESRVLIDLSTVSRIDSTGIGVLMNCYCHALGKSGALKLLQPTAPVRQVLKITNLDTVLESFEDETAALRSFGERALNS